MATKIHRHNSIITIPYHRIGYFRSIAQVMITNKLRVVAAGRGRSMCLEPIVQAVLDLLPSSLSSLSSSSSSSSTTKQEFILVYLGTATYDKEEPFQLQTQAYQKMGNCRVINLQVSEAIDAASQIPTKEELRSTLLSAHVILVSGGNTLYAIRRWQELGIDAMIRKAVEINEPSPILCGGSAGAICWFACGHSDSMDPTTFLHPDPNLTEEKKKDWKYIRVQGLGYIPAMCVPHHDATQSNGLPRADDSDGMIWIYPELPLIGIDENAALVVSNGQARVVSGDGIAGCVVKRVVVSEAEADSNQPRRLQATVFREAHGNIDLKQVLQGRLPR